MRHTRGRLVEVESEADLDRHLAAGTGSFTGWRLQGLDLRGYGEVLARTRVAGALFLGCTFEQGDESLVRARGAIVFPHVPGSPVDAYRTSLYEPHELFDTDDYADSLDARAYAWSRCGRDADGALARTLHDHAVDDALGDWVRERRLVGVMGGHALERGRPDYAAASRLGHALGATHTVATGGGPGAMEAANLGGYLAAEPPEALEDALVRLARVPSFRPSVGAWASVALEVVAAHPQGSAGLGIPTWHYGHEPPNVFATAIAKYFHNATREAILLEICAAGIVFLPGAAGTVQEIFQDACENYYAEESTTAPMVLVGADYWTRTFPAWPLLQALARGRAMEQHVHLVDTPEEASALVAAG